jgi:hypothetical protein
MTFSNVLDFLRRSCIGMYSKCKQALAACMFVETWVIAFLVFVQSRSSHLFDISRENAHTSLIYHVKMLTPLWYITWICSHVLLITKDVYFILSSKWNVQAVAHATNVDYMEKLYHSEDTKSFVRSKNVHAWNALPTPTYGALQLKPQLNPQLKP